MPPDQGNLWEKIRTRGHTERGRKTTDEPKWPEAVREQPRYSTQCHSAGEMKIPCGQEIQIDDKMRKMSLVKIVFAA